MFKERGILAAVFKGLLYFIFQRSYQLETFLEDLFHGQSTNSAGTIYPLLLKGDGRRI